MYETLIDLFTAIADAIRAKIGKEDDIPAQDFPSEIEGIEGSETIEDCTRYESVYTSNVVTVQDAGAYVSVISDTPLPKCVGQRITENTGARILIDWDDFGDATAEDVRKGKTFTSSSGVKITGTMEETELETLTVTYFSERLGTTDTVEFKYYPGNTWAIAVNLNDNYGFTVDSNYVYYNGIELVNFDTGSNILPTDVINKNSVYYTYDAINYM